MECFECAQSAIPEAADLADEEIELQEHVKRIHLHVPADLCWDWEDFQGSTEEHPVHIAVWREPSGRSRQERLEPGEIPLLERLQQGVRIASLFDSLPDPEPSEEEITRWFAKWQGHGWLGVRGKHGKQELGPDGAWEGMDRMGSQAVAMD